MPRKNFYKLKELPLDTAVNMYQRLGNYDNPHNAVRPELVGSGIVKNNGIGKVLVIDMTTDKWVYGNEKILDSYKLKLREINLSIK